MKMKIVMILMMKNEEKILKRCLEAVESLVDGYCILDTGSTDSSKEVAEDFLKGRVGCVTQDPFRDFGYSRTKSFENAQKYLKENTDWDLTQTYGLLLDADMIFVPGTLKQQKLTAIGYSLIQKNGAMEYFNARLVRMDHPWKCASVTHEYWDGHTEKIEKSVCFIDDKNDGGCKSDKFERDKRLLEQGLIDEPANVRYMFYLAQTYKCLSMWKESIDMYQKRIDVGGWGEEIYYSYYMIGECYLNMRDILNFERYMQMAYNYRPSRGETIYKLAEFYRTVGEHYKSYHYIQLGRKIPFPKDDVLFIEPNVYNCAFDYEASIVDYYIHPDRGLSSSMAVLLKTSDYTQNIVSNMKHYVKPVQGNVVKINAPSPFGDVFRPSAISVVNYPFANVRFVNYKILPNGSYDMPNGIVDTKNAYFNLETMECISAFDDPKNVPDSHIKGLEDLRLYSKNDQLYFTATSVCQFIPGKIAIAHGKYDYANKTYKDCVGINSPIKSECEKNWVHVPGTDDFIYGWHPLRIGQIQGNQFKFKKAISVPPFFSLLRGSAPPIEVDGKWLVLTHFVEHCTPRNYYHCFVELDKHTYFPTKDSFPFVFQKAGIEFSISGRAVGHDQVEFYVSSWDCNPFKIIFNCSQLRWVSF
jgi:glycosyltransferase involved in cell wall biosynthesis